MNKKKSPDAVPTAVPQAVSETAPAATPATAASVPTASAGPSIPLSPSVRAAYQSLYDLLKDAALSRDPAVLDAVNPCLIAVEQVLIEDDLYQMRQDTAVFASLQKQIKFANDGLATLRGQVSAIAGHFAMAGDILAAIDKVLSFV